MASFCLRVGSGDDVLLMNESFEEKKGVGVLTEEREDVFWTVAVPSGCRWASDLASSEAGVTMFVFQTLKDESEKIAATEVLMDLTSEQRVKRMCRG